MTRIRELDAMRGLAALTIVVYHLWLIQYAALGTAVDLFFVLSGYLITAIILRHGGTAGFLRSFYARRLLRIWPIYYLTLFALVLVNPLLPEPEPLDGLPYYLAYLQNLPLYWSDRSPAFITAFRHTWTLAIEEQFYLIWPAVVLLVGRDRLWPLGLSLLGMSVWARSVGYEHWILMSRCDGLVLGGLLAVALDDRERVALRRGMYRAAFGVLIVAGVGLLAASKLAPGGWMADVARGSRLLAINLVYCGLVGLVVVSNGNAALGWLRTGWLCGLGTISYGLYLYHHIVFLALAGLGERWGIGGESRWLDAPKLALSLGLAVVSWRYVEQPLLRLKDRFAYPRTAIEAGAESEPEPVRTSGEVLLGTR